MNLLIGHLISIKISFPFSLMNPSGDTDKPFLDLIQISDPTIFLLNIFSITLIATGSKTVPHDTFNISMSGLALRGLIQTIFGKISVIVTFGGEGGHRL